MATAYDTQGRLKKHPLLGTALGVDPSRAEEREQFLTLHKEATSIAGEGRKGMEGRLASRYAERTASEQQALGGLGSQYAELQKQGASLRDPSKDKELAEAVASSRADWSNVQSAKKLVQITPELQTKFKEQMGLDPRGFRKWKRKHKTPISRAEAIQKHFGGKLSEVELQQKEYEEELEEKASALQAQGAPIAAEMQRRKGKLEDMIYSYNMFLGVG